MKNKIIFVVFLIWASVVVYYYNRAFPIEPKYTAEYLAACSSSFKPKEALLYLGGAVVEILLACLLLAISFILGRKFTASLKKDLDTPGFFAVSSAAGFCIMACFIFLAAAAGILFQTLIFSLFIALCIYALFELKRKPAGLKFEVKKYGGFEKILLAITVVFMLFNLIAALTPETFFDSLEYHLALPAAYLLNHGFTPLQFNIFSGFPGNAEMLYLTGLVLSGSVTAKLINFLFGALLLVSVYSFSKKYLSRPAGLFSAAIFSLVPMVAVNLINTQVDCLSAFWFFLSFYLALNASEKGFLAGKKALIFSGIFAGFGMGIKYSGIIYAAAILGMLLYLCLKSKAAKKAPVVAGIFILFSLIPVVPWLIKNYIYFSNPVYPYFSDAPGLTRLLSEQTGAAVNSVLKIVRLPWDLTFSRPLSASMNLGPLFLAFSPLLLWALFKKNKESTQIKALLIVIVISLIGWLCMTRIARFFIPGLLFLSLYTGNSVIEFLKKEKEEFFHFSVYTLVIVIALHNLFWVTNVNIKKMDPLALFSGKITGEEYLSTPRSSYPNPYYKAVEFINKQKNELSGKVLFIGETRAFYCKKPFIAGSAYDAVPLETYIKRAAAEGGLKQVLQKENISFALVNLREGERLSSYYKTDLMKLLQSAEFSETFETVFREDQARLYVFSVKK
ncbi:MAG: glycosyltransferase family 39 protein [Candidatus Firestonebacteria bacterium]|nr:glycosyltransferase family 39 protein [Candidatus Firestonebacteria bacterium]